MDKEKIKLHGGKMKDIISMLMLTSLIFLLGGCKAKNNISGKQKVILQQEIIKNEKEDMIWAIPSWCEILEHEPFELKACGIAESPKLQNSRTRSELDARKQIIKILSNKCIGSEKEEIRYGKTFFNSSYKCETGEVSIKNAVIKNRKTVRVGNNFLTFTEMSLFY